MTALPEPSNMPDMERVRDLHVEIRIEDGSLWATVREYFGVFATGDNLDELRDSIAEGIALMLAIPGESAPTVSLGDLRSTSDPVAATAHLVCA